MGAIRKRSLEPRGAMLQFRSMAGREVRTLATVGGLAAMGLALLACGGRTTLSDATVEDGGADSGASADAGQACDDAPTDCGGAAGLADSTRVHTACSGSVTVNRKGEPVKIVCHIK